MWAHWEIVCSKGNFPWDSLRKMVGSRVHYITILWKNFPTQLIKNNLQLKLAGKYFPNPTNPYLTSLDSVLRKSELGKSGFGLRIIS